MAQMTTAFPDKSFSGIGGIAEFAHALNYFLLGCGTVQVCTAAMLDHAIGPERDPASCSSGWSSFSRVTPTGLAHRSTTSAACAAIASSRTATSGDPTPRQAHGGHDAPEGYAVSAVKTTS